MSGDTYSEEARIRIFKEYLEREYGQVWDEKELAADFEVIGIYGPYVEAKNKKTRKKGTLSFQNRPRFYWGWDEDLPKVINL